VSDPPRRSGLRPGLQPQRTALAWQRTAVSASLALLPPLLVDVRLGFYRLLFPGLVGALVAAGLLLGVRRRMRRLGTGAVPQAADSPSELIARVAAVTALAAVGGVLTALSLYWS